MFQCGTHKTQMHLIKANTGLGEPYEIPVPWYVITHPRGNVLIDGGNAPAVAVDPVAHWGRQLTDFFWPEMTPDEAVLPQLERVGIAPESIRWIVQSHLHVDHTGAVATAASFPNARVLVTRREHEYARHPDWFTSKSYVQAEFNDPNIRWSLLEDGEDGYDLYGDGVLRCWRSPGHSPGHQSFTVKLVESGTFLLTSDAAYTVDHWEERALPGIATSAVEATRSVQRLHRIAERAGATVVTGHDPDVWPTFEHAPGFYT